MDTFIAFLRRRNTIVAVTAISFVLSFLLSLLAGRDLVVMGIEQPKRVSLLQQEWGGGAPRPEHYATMRILLKEHGHPQVDTLSDQETYKVFADYARKTPVPHLARFVSAFAACLYLLLFWMLYHENKIPGDYSILFFALAMICWALPTETAFRQYGGFWMQHAKALGDMRGFNNTLFLLAAWWDLDDKGLPNFDKKRWLKPFVATLLVLGAGMTLAFFAGRAHSKDLYADNPPGSWYDYFEFFITIPFCLVMIRALYSGASKWIQPTGPTRISRWLGVVFGALTSLGFVFVLLYYLMNNPVIQLKQLESIINSSVIILLYQFLILISVSVLVFSWAFDNLRRIESREAAVLDAQRRQSNHLARGAVLNQILYLQSIRAGLKTPEAAVYDDLIRRLNASLEYQRHIDAYLGSDVRKTSLHRLFTRTWKKFFDNEPDIVFDTDNIRLEHLPEMDTENAGRITQAAFEMANNAIKSIRKAHNERPFLSVEAGTTDAELFIRITDNGEGNYDSATYSGEPGFGTQFLNNIVREHFKGHWRVQPRTDGQRGSEAYIHIPLHKI